MIISMTGFSKAEASTDSTTVSVEIKTVNGRGLDVNVRMPRSLSDKEFDIKNKVKKKVSRGTVNVYINVDNDESTTDFHIDEKAASQVKDKLDKMRKSLKIRETVKLDHLNQYSSFFLQKEETSNPELEYNLASSALDNALNELVKMRKKEGSNISKDINKRVKKIHELIKVIEVEGIEKIPQERERLREKVAQLFDNDEIDEQRLQMEMVLMADKLDISEECVRMNSHIKLFFDTMKERKSNGRKMNFLLQEMLRETNTIGSKCNDASIAHKVVGVKEELERIREQVQNVE